MINKFLLREPAPLYNKKKLSVTEYLELERTSPEKHEYYQGEMFAMAGAGDEHNLIFSNVFGELASHLRDHPCRAMGSDMRMHIAANSLFTYPDIAVYCENPQYYADTNDNLTNPTMIIEILSQSTKRYDSIQKFRLYRAIPSLTSYILIDSTAVFVESHMLTGKGWIIDQDISALNETLRLPVIGHEISLRRIYKDTGLDGGRKLVFNRNDQLPA